MATRALDERVVLASGFRLVARNLLGDSQALWTRDDEPARSYSDAEVIDWLEQNPQRRTDHGASHPEEQTTEVDAELGTFTAVVSSWSAGPRGRHDRPHAFDQSID